MTCKERFEELDEENKSMKVDLFEGDVMEAFKSFKFIIKVTNKVGGGSITKWSFFYEKIHEGIPEPKGYLDFATSVTKDVDSYLLGAQKAK